MRSAKGSSVRIDADGDTKLIEATGEGHATDCLFGLAKGFIELEEASRHDQQHGNSYKDCVEIGFEFHQGTAFSSPPDGFRSIVGGQRGYRSLLSALYLPK